MISPGGITLKEAPATADLGGGQISNVLAYNNSFPGPTLEARSGDTATIHLDNGLAQETITHWHGMIVDEWNDGGPPLAVPPGGSHAYAFPIIQRACLNWYHPHPHGNSDAQVGGGMSGVFLVGDLRQRTSDPTMAERPQIKLNAGYLDGRVESFNAWDARGVKNYQAQAFLAPKAR